MEALACAKPVLVSDIPGNKEWITDGMQGWLFPDGDVYALAKGIISAFDQRQQLAGMASGAFTGRTACRLDPKFSGFIGCI